MFLLPLVAAAGVAELAYAISATESLDKNNNKPKSVPPRSPMPGKPTEPIVTLPDSSDENKQLVVFSEKANHQQGLTVPGQPGEIPLTERAIKLACQSLVGSFPFPTFGVAEEICVAAANIAVKQGIELTKSVVTKYSSIMVNKLKGVSGKRKAVIRKEINSIVEKASKSRVAAPGPSMKQSRGMVSVGVNAPVVSTRVVGRQGAPRTKTIKDGLSITHSELITSIVSSSSANTFKAQGFVINPGKGDVFPWLSTMAVNYDKYRIRSFLVEVITFSPTSVAGRVGIAYDPDSTDALPYDRTEFFAMDKHMQGPVWQTIMLELPTPKTELFVNSHTTTDSKLIDAGQFVVMTDQLASASVSIADVVVHYTVELLKPQQALYQTQYCELSNASRIGGTFLLPPVARGCTISKIYSNDSTQAWLAPPVGAYMVTILNYDGDSGTPNLTIGNYTGSNLYYWAPTSTNQIAGRVIVFKITVSPSVTDTAGVVGQHINWTPTTVAPANLEAQHLLLTRISPSIFQYIDVINHGGWTQLSSS